MIAATMLRVIVPNAVQYRSLRYDARYGQWRHPQVQQSREAR
jgi:hypothetical protein